MSLITRCPACETLFKVVPDQLRISEGWVRCGQCDEVFDASHHLVQEPLLPPEPVQPPETQALTTSPEAVVAEEAPDSAPEVEPESESDLAPEPEPEPEFPSALAPSSALYAPHFLDIDLNLDDLIPVQDAALQHSPDVREPHTDHSLPLSPVTGLEAETPEDERAPALAPLSARDEEPSSSAASEVLADLDEPPAAVASLDEMSFMREKPPEDPPHKPWFRVFWSLVAVILMLALAAQWIYRQRDQLVAHQPQLAPWFLALCQPLNCTLSPWRNIQALTIESSSFAKLRADVYQLSFSLKNTSPVEVARPAMELTLTDALDRAIVRRVFGSDQLGVESLTLAGGQEWVLSVPLIVDASASPERIAGYRLLAFYPDP